MSKDNLRVFPRALPRREIHMASFIPDRLRAKHKNGGERHPAGSGFWDADISWEWGGRPAVKGKGSSKMCRWHLPSTFYLDPRGIRESSVSTKRLSPCGLEFCCSRRYQTHGAGVHRLFCGRPDSTLLQAREYRWVRWKPRPMSGFVN